MYDDNRETAIQNSEICILKFEANKKLTLSTENNFSKCLRL